MAQSYREFHDLKISRYTEQRHFELLRKAYIDARYKEYEYAVTKEELEWLAERVIKLQNLTEEACNKKIESFKTKTDDEAKL